MAVLSRPVVEQSTWLPSKSKLIVSLAVVVAALALGRRRLSITGKSARKTSTLKETSPETFDKHKKLFPVVDVASKVGVNQEFRRQLRAIAAIILPHWRTKEVLLLVLHSFFLILRTYLSVVVARIDGRIVRDLVRVFSLKSIGRQKKAHRIKCHCSRWEGEESASCRDLCTGSPLLFLQHTPTVWLVPRYCFRCLSSSHSNVN